MKIKIYTDGGARNNPGPAGIGVVLYDENGEILKTFKEYIGEGTNNEAEYRGLLAGLKLALDFSKEAEFFLDSELLVKQLNGQYRVKNENLRKFYDEAQVLKMGFTKISFNHVRREQNKLADKLVNEAIDESLNK